MMAKYLQNISATIKNAPLWLRLFLCLACGAATATALSPTYFIIGAFFGFGLFYVLLSTLTPRTSILGGWLFGFGYFTTGLYWIGNALLVEGNEYAWAWPLAVAGLPAILAFYTAFASYIVRRLGALSYITGFILFISAFSLAEFLRGHLFTGFPWNLYGYIWGDSLPIMQSLSLWGAYGLTALTLLWGGTAGFLLCAQNRKHATIVLSFSLTTFIAVYAYGAMRLEKADELSGAQTNIALHIVQPAIKQEDKWNREKKTLNMRKLLDLTRQAQSAPGTKTIIIWPETAISSYMTDNPAIRDNIKTALPVNSYLMTGFLDINETQNKPDASEKTKKEKRIFHNSLAVFDENMNRVAIYHKSHLVPFGEYIPFQKWIPLSPVTRFTGFESGQGPTTVKIAENNNIPPFSPLICYEIIFPADVTRHESGKNAQNPAWIVNVTNDAWYGDSAGPYQHLDKARYRAIEEGLPVVRAANTGISAIIDPFGHMQTLGLGVYGTHAGELPPPVASKTFYAHYNNALFLLFSLLVFGLSVFLCRKNKP